MEKQEMKFAEGMMFKPRLESQSEAVRGGIHFKARDFIKFLEENVDEKGWVHVKMMKSLTKGSIYFILDTWKPTPQAPVLTEIEEINNKSSEKLIGRPLTEEESLEMLNIPF